MNRKENPGKKAQRLLEGWKAVCTPGKGDTYTRNTTSERKGPDSETSLWVEETLLMGDTGSEAGHWAMFQGNRMKYAEL